MPFSSRKLVKVAAGVAIGAVGLYVVLSEGVAVVSANAVVNARVAVVRAPIDGILALEPLSVGQRLRRGESLGTLADERVDAARLLDLERIERELVAETARLEADIRAATGAVAELGARAAAYQAGRIGQLQAKVQEARATLAAAEARLAESDASFVRARELRAGGNQSVAGLDKARATKDVDALEAAAARHRLESTEIELAAARRGTFLGDSYNDTPFSTQRAQELSLRQAELDATLKERRDRLAAVRDQLGAERHRVARLRDALLESPVDGLVWEASLGAGEYARKGQNLLRLLDCRTVLVTASVAESDYNRLKVGDPARFRISGTGKVYEGIVLRLAGSGAATVYENLAVAPGKEQLERFDVALSFPGLIDDPAAACAVGRTGKVTFAGAPSDVLRTLARWLGFA
ncbi:HlyD family efflux transporter periplasmic adaptor subunit [Arenibaculum pallidiluteum]|uniref:HlyD family efflux transporter periplasmic adaptor subunit n=1 Tax=Arenibaculum pallidiluteum TaxID=2812559 RepID=UPI001A97A1C8|nr:HlyD family secretion protein [Arenibaculum pallidiluteum]